MDNEEPSGGPILIVDDDEDVGEDFRAVVERAGHDVLMAENGRVALDILLAAAPQPRLVLLDLKMPVMDGWELLALMRSYNRLNRIPVILITATTMRAASRPAFDAILMKPVSEEALLEAIQKVLSP